MKVLSVLLGLALVASAGVLSPATAQAGGTAAASADEQSITGEIQSIDTAAKELTLKDGTKLVIKDDAKMQDLKEGATVAAKYKTENGQNVVTSLDVEAPAASPVTTSPGTTSPAAPSTDSEKKQ